MQPFKASRSLYEAYLEATSVRHSALSLSEIAPLAISHDSISRLLRTKKYTPSQLFQQAKDQIELDEKHLLIVDDTVLNKSRSEYIELVQRQYSGNQHRVIKGIGLVNMLYFNQAKKTYCPIDFKIYANKEDGYSKNDHFRKMLKQAHRRGCSPKSVVMDCWYANTKNFQCIDSLGWKFTAPLKTNRIVNKKVKITSLTIPDHGLKVHLRGYGKVMLFRFESTNRHTEYIVTNDFSLSREEVRTMIHSRWSIEVYHRELKSTCGIERCQALTGRSQRNHIFMSISVWLKRNRIRSTTGKSPYWQQWEVIRGAIASKIVQIMTDEMEDKKAA